MFVSHMPLPFSIPVVRYHEVFIVWIEAYYNKSENPY